MTTDSDTTTPEATPQSSPTVPDQQLERESTPDSAEGSEARTDEQVREARKDAATYRRRLRDVEAEAARLAGVVESYQRSAVEALAEQGPRALASGSDLWVTGVELAALVDGEGQPDLDKITAAVAAALQQRPHWRRSSGSADGGPRGAAQDSSTSWSSVLGSKR